MAPPRPWAIRACRNNIGTVVELFEAQLFVGKIVGPPKDQEIDAALAQVLPLGVAGPSHDMKNNPRIAVNGHSSTGCDVNVHEITPGVVYQDGNVTVTAFSAQHEDMVDSF